MEFLKAAVRALAGAAGEASRPLALGEFTIEGSATHRLLSGSFEVAAAVVFAPSLQVYVRPATGAEFQSSSADSTYIGWLPRGRYAYRLLLPSSIAAGEAQVAVTLGHQQHMAQESAHRRERRILLDHDASGSQSAHWSLESIAPTPSIEALSWKKGHADWFFRHFDHAATTIIGYLLGESPLLRKRILDVGCGDGITDLGVALRTGCEKLVGIDPFKGYERLPRIIADNHLPPDAVPPTLTFRPEDANRLPFEDDSFEVVISWGSVEHMAGGYRRALEEIRRVLVPDGLFVVVPGLFYSDIGHHLGEFSSEPFFHLKKPPEELRRMVLETPPRYIDRSGEFASNEQYWQWYTELNRITVAGFEKELRDLGFEPWRAALRTNPLVEYTPELQAYSIEQLANNELYLSCHNRKSRPR